MGTKYTTEAISGYNASPPPDDATESEANKIKWSTIKEKLDDPIKTQVENIDTKLVAMADIGPDAKIAAYTTVAGDHQKTIEMTADFDVTLLAVASAPDGYTITVKNSSGAAIEVSATGSETIDGSTGAIMLADDEITKVQLNNDGTGYITLQQTASEITSAAQVYKGTAAGTADVITVSLTPTLTALTDGTVIFVRAYLANATTTPTLNPDGLGGNTIVKNGNQLLSASDIPRVNYEMVLRYSSANTAWELMNPARRSSAAQRTRTTTQNISNATITIIDYETLVYDNLSELDNTGRFTATTAGKYHISAQATLGSVAWDLGEYVILYIYKNGSEEKRGVWWSSQAVSTTAQQVGVSISVDVDLDASDYIDIRIQHNQGGTPVIVADGSYNFFSVHSID